MGRSTVGEPASTASEPEAGPTATDTAEATPARSALEPEASNQPPPPQLLTTRVVDPTGAPLTDARILWIALTEDDRYLEPAWRESDWGPLERDSATATSDSLGRFEMGVPLGGTPFGSVVGVWHPHHLARALVLEANVTELPEPEIVLQPAPGFGVLVVDDQGQPAQRVLVGHYGLAERGEAGVDKLPTEEAARRFLIEEAVTDAQGRARFSPFPGASVLQARDEGQVSLPWRGQPSGEITLLLADSFEALGKLRLPPLQPEEDDEGRLLIQAFRGGHWQDLVQLRGAQDGEWGPALVPLVEADLFRVRYERYPFVPAEHAFATPRPGSRIRADLTAERGVELWFVIQDERGDPILNAEATVFWEEAQPRAHLSSYTQRATEEGWVHYLGAPSGRFRFEIQAPGYATHSSGWFHTSSYVGFSTMIQLTPAGKLRGVVRGDSGPLQDFEVSVWLRGEPHSRVRRSFTRRPDGTFEMLDVPIGDLMVAARSGLLLGSQAATVTIPAGGMGEVELVVGETIAGRGRVLDATTLQPVTHATVQAGMPGALGEHDVLGLPEPVQPDGSFALDAFVPGRSTVIVRAEGFGRHEVSRTSAEGEVDFGNLLLEPVQAFTVRLTGFEDLDPTTVSVSCDGAGGELAFFDHSGVAVLTETTAGFATVRIDFPDRPMRVYGVDLRQGEPWELECSLGGARRLTVILEGADGAPQAAFERVGALFVRGLEETGRDFVLVQPFVEPTMDFRGLPIESGMVQLESTEGLPLSAAALRVRSGAGNGGHALSRPASSHRASRRPRRSAGRRCQSHAAGAGTARSPCGPP